MVYGLEFLLSYVGTEATQKGRFDSGWAYFSSNFLYVCQGRKRDRVELELVVELTRTRELLYGFGASSFPSSRSFEFEFDEATGLRDRVFTEFLWKRLKSWFEFEKRHFPSTGRGPKGSPF